MSIVEFIKKGILITSDRNLYSDVANMPLVSSPQTQ